MLLVNKRNREITISLPDNMKGARLSVIDSTTGENEAAQSTLSGTEITLKPFAIAVLAQ